MTEEQELYQIFHETRQESQRLQAALEGFFQNTSPIPEEHKKEYGQYLKRRIRPAVEQLIRDESVEKIRELEQLGWFHEQELEGFIKTAQRYEKPASLMYFLQRKDEVYGYHDKDFSL